MRLLPAALAFGIGAFLVLTNSNIPFANGPSCDTWHFFGRFFVGDQPLALPYSREGSRIPEFIFGYLFQRVAHGVRVEYANFFVFFLAACLGVYYAARSLFGSFAAYVALILFAAQPLIAANFSVTYTEGATAYSALAMAFAIRAATMPRDLRAKCLLFFAGFLWAAAIHAHLESLTMNFIIVLYCIDWGERSWTKLIRDAAASWIPLALGALVATVVFGIVNVLVFHGSFYFFARQFHDVLTVTIIAYEKSNWYLQGGRGALLLAGAALVVGQALWLWRGGASHEEKTPVKAALFPFIVLLVAQLGYTFLDHGLALQYDYWFVWILAPLALLVASVAYRAKASGVYAASFLTLYLVTSLLAEFGRLDLIWRVGSIPICFSIALMSFPILLWLLIKRPMAAVAVCALVFVLLAATIRPEKIGLLVWGSSSQRDVYKRIDAGMEFLAKHRFESNPKFWMDSRNARWETIAYPRAYSGCLAQNLLPDLIAPDTAVYNPGAETFQHGDYLVMVPSDSREHAAALRTLAQKGFTFHEIDRASVSYDGLAYIVVVGKLE